MTWMFEVIICLKDVISLGHLSAYAAVVLKFFPASFDLLLLLLFFPFPFFANINIELFDAIVLVFPAIVVEYSGNDWYLPIRKNNDITSTPRKYRSAGRTECA